MKVLKCLDKGYVRLVDVMGNDLRIANAARVSYNKEAHELSERDEKLINFLAKEGHSSPFRHASMVFEVYAPLMISRQWWKHHVASSYVDDQNAWNESSRRYVTEDEEFYIPDEWRSKPENSKQGSGEPIDEKLSQEISLRLEEYIQEGHDLYKYLLEKDIAPEQARLFLPANGMYVRFYWHVSLHAVSHFLNLRVAKDSQSEIQEYARAVEQFVADSFPISYKALKGGSAE